MNLRKVIPLFAFLAVAVAGVSYAAIPAADGTITACKDNKGVLKVIDAEAGQTCGPNQQQLTWNEQGPAGISGYEVVSSTAGSGGAGDWKTFSVACPAGKKVLGGGLSSTSGLQTGLAVVGEYPTSDNNGWVGGIAETIPQPDDWHGRIWAICATV